MSRPSFATTVAALRTTDRRFPWIGPTDEEDDIAAVLEVIEQQHPTHVDQPDQRGRYGRCTGCRRPWPCPEWRRGEQLAAQWLGRAVDRVYVHARRSIDQSRSAA